MRAVLPPVLMKVTTPAQCNEVILMPVLWICVLVMDLKTVNIFALAATLRALVIGFITPLPILTGVATSFVALLSFSEAHSISWLLVYRYARYFVPAELLSSTRISADSAVIETSTSILLASAGMS